jgi:hypothetical protein
MMMQVVSRVPLPGFIYATRLGFTSVLVEYKVFVLYSKSILRAGPACRVLVPVHLHNGSDPGILICGYPKGMPTSVALETLRELQTRVESPNFDFFNL